MREHIIRRKHKEFFAISRRGDLNIDMPQVLSNPTYRVLTELFKSDETVHGVELNDQLGVLAQDCAFLDELPLQPAATRDYSIAENWAVAAELLSRDSSSHCFDVGRAARAIGS